MKTVFALVTVALFSILIVGPVLAGHSSSESGILIQQPSDKEMAGGTTLSFSWFLRSLPTENGCLVDAYHFPENALSIIESLEDYKVAQITTSFGMEVVVPEYSDDFIVMCRHNGQISITIRPR